MLNLTMNCKVIVKIKKLPFVVTKIRIMIVFIFIMHMLTFTKIALFDESIVPTVFTAVSYITSLVWVENENAQTTIFIIKAEFDIDIAVTLSYVWILV